MSHRVFSLSYMLSEYGDDTTRTLLSEFRCSRDREREEFLRDKAIVMEKKALTRTYMAITKEFHVVGYFSIGIKCMSIQEDVALSSNFRKKLNIDGKTNVAQMYVLGQLARSDDSEPGIGAELMDDALDIIHRAYDAVGCRAVRLDCTDSLVGYTPGTVS